MGEHRQNGHDLPSIRHAIAPRHLFLNANQHVELCKSPHFTICELARSTFADTQQLLQLTKIVTVSLDLQDEHEGGISDRPEDMCDVFHTFFGIAALSLMQRSSLVPIDPAYALPVDTVARLKAQHEAKATCAPELVAQELLLSSD